MRWAPIRGCSPGNMNNDNSQAVLLVFTRAPVPGRVKSRLIPRLGERGAAELYKTLLRRTLRTARESTIGPIQLWVTPDTEHPAIRSLSKEFDTSLHVQTGATLGERMYFALAAALKDYKNALLIGCDCPGLTGAVLDDACNRLNGDSQVVLGPADDGGYYLIGAGHAHKALFTGIQWGTCSVLPETRERLRKLNLRWSELEQQRDLDLPEDLDRYQGEFLRGFHN